MKLNRIIRSEIEESTVRERLARYFAFAGYTQEISQPHLLSYRRGRFLALTAKGCTVNAVIQISPTPDQTTEVAVTLDIDTTGQFVIERERKYWREQMTT